MRYQNSKKVKAASRLLSLQSKRGAKKDLSVEDGNAGNFDDKNESGGRGKKERHSVRISERTRASENHIAREEKAIRKRRVPS